MMNALNTQQQADHMLRECRIVETLERYGDVFLHGSYQMGLMTWPEIDVWLLNDEFRSQQAWDIVGELAKTVSPTHIHVINQLDHDLGRTPPDAIAKFEQARRRRQQRRQDETCYTEPT